MRGNIAFINVILEQYDEARESIAACEASSDAALQKAYPYLCTCI